jgi:hypothetical protein
MFNELIWEAIIQFVDIGGIVDHHCLNFLFVRIRFFRVHWMKLVDTRFNSVHGIYREVPIQSQYLVNRQCSILLIGDPYFVCLCEVLCFETFWKRFVRFNTLHHIHKMLQNCWRKSFLNTQNSGASGGWASPPGPYKVNI